MTQYRDEGIVLRTYRLGESDRIVVMATRDHGKIRAVAKGIRKTKSRFGARLEPLSHVSVLLWKGRSLDIIQQVEVIAGLAPLRETLDVMSAAAAIAEVADHSFLDDLPNPDLYTMTVKALVTLASTGSPMVLPAYFFKVLLLDGVGPVVEVCAHCGASEPLVAFDMNHGGALCRSCRRGAAAGPEALGIVRAILSGGLSGVLAADIDPAVVHEVRHLATEALEHHLECRLRSIRILEKV